MCLSLILYGAAQAALVALLCVLSSRFVHLLLLVVASFTVGFTVLHLTFGAQNNGSESSLEHWGAFAKVMGMVPFGVGSVFWFASKPDEFRVRYANAFSAYVNAAVLGNIAAMSLTPIGDTARGIAGRCACAALVLWLAQEMAAKKWRTVRFPQGTTLFLFNASPLSWVLCHAFYRAGLVSLPAFKSRRYVFFEVLSLATMGTLWFVFGRKRTDRGQALVLPCATFFGMADTLVASTVGALSATLDDFGLLTTPAGCADAFPFAPTEKMIDAGFVLGNSVVCLVAVWKVLSAFRS